MSLPPSPPELGPLDRQNVVALDEAPSSRLRRTLREVFETILLALVLFLAINFVSARVRVEFNSMYPNFHNGDYVIVNRLAYRWAEPQRGDVVVFPYPNDPDEDYIKRVIGLPGERIAIYAGKVYINGQALEEAYASEPIRLDMSERIVPPEHVFVIGDNRNASSDSREWGALPISDIIGKAVFRYFPFDAIGVVQHYALPDPGDS
ncbi:MAG: signal peptidase I [Anaerolineales bacterium]|nr:signal peptidase I [Anaerolineales bacterium]